MSNGDSLGRRLGKPVRLALRKVGVGLYHLGLSHRIVELSPHRIRALLYHSVESKAGSYTAGLKVNVTPATFDLHMDYVRSHYSVSTIETALDGLGGPCPALITFDDGYFSVEKNAVPILEKYELPATVFLIGSAVNGGVVWVNELNHALNRHPHAVESILPEFPTLAGLNQAEMIFQVQTTFSPAEVERLLRRLAEVIPPEHDTLRTGDPLFSSADGILAMQTRGMHFGFHTQDHFNLQLCDDANLNIQLDAANVAPLLNSNTFAYPFGYYSREAIRKLTQQGYEQLMTVGSGTRSSSALHTGRCELFGTTTADIFAQLEIEEPAMAMLRKTFRFVKRLVSGSGLEQVGGTARSSELSGGISPLPLESDLPETSKPR